MYRELSTVPSARKAHEAPLAIVLHGGASSTPGHLQSTGKASVMEFQAVAGAWGRILMNTRARTAMANNYGSDWWSFAVNPPNLVFPPSPLGSTVHPKHTTLLQTQSSWKLKKC